MWTLLIIIHLWPDSVISISLVRWNPNHLGLLPRLPFHAGVVARWPAETVGARDAGRRSEKKSPVGPIDTAWWTMRWRSSSSSRAMASCRHPVLSCPTPIAI